MTEAQLKEFLEANKADIQAAVKKAAIEKMIAEYRWDISEQISKAVNAFVAAEVIPAVQEELASQRGAIVNAAVASIANICDDLAKGLAVDAVKNTADEWRRKQVLKALFNI